jgi:hypothetical protein
MTAIDITDLDTQIPARPEPTRDRYGRPLITPVGGGKPVGYTRVTTLAKALDDGGGLIPWKATATIVGAMRRQGLFARWQALASKAQGDPWYHSAETKAAAKKLVEECAEAGGSTDRADLGTALHAIAEQADLGRPVHIQPNLRADLDAYHATLAAHGVEILPEWMERFVVLDDWQVAGTFDRLVRMPDGRLVVADLKTGADLKYSWQSIAVQLAAYAHGLDYDVTTAVRTPLPEHDMSVGLVIHLPAGTGTCTLYTVDLVAGWEAAELSLRTRVWRTRRDLATPLPASPQVTGGEGEPASPPIQEKTVSGVNTGDTSEGAPPAAGVAVIGTAGRPVDRRAWLLERVVAINAIPSAKAVLGALWPVDIPRKKSHRHTIEQLDALEAVIVQVERQHQMPFTPGPSPEPPAAPAPSLAVVAPVVDDTELAPDGDIDALAATIAALAPERLSFVKAMVGAANAAGHPINVSKRAGAAPARRIRIARALIAWAEYGEEFLRAGFAALGHHVDPDIPTGLLVGACSLDDAVALEALATALDDDSAAVEIDAVTAAVRIVRAAA